MIDQHRTTEEQTTARNASSPLIMGVLNITPDSFSDGGCFVDHMHAVDHAVQMIELGADIIDIGAESTKPGSLGVSDAKEWERLEPVLAKISAIVQPGKISIDTKKPDIMLKALHYGVAMINNVSGLADPGTLSQLAKESQVSYIAMHMAGTPETMQINPLKAGEVTLAIDRFCDASYNALLNAGFSHQRIYLDPGIGFGKTVAANIRILAHVFELTKKYNVAIGVSRKSWIGHALEIELPIDRDIPTKMVELGMIFAGVRLIRTHEVRLLKKLRDFWRGDA